MVQAPAPPLLGKGNVMKKSVMCVPVILITLLAMPQSLTATCPPQTTAIARPCVLGDLDCDTTLTGTDVLVQASLVVDLIECTDSFLHRGLP